MNSSLFSHAEQPEPAKDAASVPDVVVKRQVPRELHEAFNGFTEYLHLWWPEEFTEFGEGTHPEIESAALTESGPEGESAVWATVAERVQDSEIVLDWVRGHSPQTPTEVRISFEPVDAATTSVTVQHSGFATVPEAEEAAGKFAVAWPQILDRYARFMGAR